MEAKTKRNIESVREYDALFPKAKLTDSTVKRGATVGDTVKFIPKVVQLCCWQTKQLSELLRGDDTYSTCRNIWEFVYNHIRYHKDEDGHEQIRSPARTWHDRARGVDCDCYTVFISTLLSNLRIPHALRITKYNKDYFQHIYPIVPTKDGGYITMDCVVDNFNYEEPYTEKKDTPMDLQFLEGLDDVENGLSESPEELGKKGWFKRFTHKALHAFNRFNPATVLLRNGVLACMKLNLFKVAQRLKYAYWTEAQAKAKGVDINKWHQLVKIKDKLENIFFGAGGKPQNFKHAMLTGKGNKNHDVNGLGYIPKGEVFEMDIDTPLPQLLGKEIYESEVRDLRGFGELGDPATGTAVAAATGVMGIIAELIKKIGNIFPKKDDAGSEDFKTTSEDDKAASDAAASAKPSDQASVDKASDSAASNKTDSGSGDNSGGDNSDPGSDGKKQSFWEKNKKWLKPTLWGTAIAGAAFGGYELFKSKKKGSKRSGSETHSKPTDGLKGTPKKGPETHSNAKRMPKKKGKGGEKEAVALV